jgi:prepilin peptidase CpaA
LFLKMMTYAVLGFWLLAGVLIYACYTDLRFRKVYNTLIVFGLISSLGLWLLNANVSGGMQWLQGVGLAFMCFMPLYLLKGMAAGDVKLAMVVGGIVGSAAWMPVAVCIYLVGGVLAMGVVLMQKQGMQLMRNLNAMLFFKLHHTPVQLDMEDETGGINSVGRMPYALAIAIGTLMGVYTQHM